MPPSQIDHLTVTAPSLAAGSAFVQEVLGVAPQAGGEHPRMGTHNLLLRLGDSLFLEVIAANPQVPAPDRPRWFGLDQLPRPLWSFAESAIVAGLSLKRLTAEAGATTEPVALGAC